MTTPPDKPERCEFCQGTGQHLCPDVAEPILVSCSKKGCPFAKPAESAKGGALKFFVGRWDTQGAPLKPDQIIKVAITLDKRWPESFEVIEYAAFEQMKRERDEARAEVDRWKAKYIDARKSGYAEGLEESQAQLQAARERK